MKVLFFLIFFPAIALGQVPGDGIPERAGTTSPVNVTYSVGGSLVSETFQAPNIIRDFGKVGYIDTSPIDANRVLENLPTFGLAKWHWWLFGEEILAHAQKDYARCVGEIRGYQRLLGIFPLIDEPTSALYDVVNSILHYLIPFEVIQRFDGNTALPPTIAEARAHARAAIDTINLTVYHRGLCEQTADYYRGLVAARMH